MSSSEDAQIVPGPTDTVSQISVCPVADFVAVSSWDNQVAILGVLIAIGQGLSNDWGHFFTEG